MAKKKWPGISVTEEDRQIIKRLQDYNGVLRSAQMKDIFLMAASIAVKKGIPAYMSSDPRNSQIVHPDLLNKDEYAEYRQYISLIFFLTEGKKDLANMSDTNVMVRNFIDYGERGLRLLERDYLEINDGSNKLFNEFVQLLNPS
jgi:hypothetical protein